MKRLIAAAALALVLVPAALAKDSLRFDRLRAHVGQTVVVESDWNSHPNGLVAYLVPMAKSARFWRIPYNGSYAPNSGPPPRMSGVLRLGRVPEIAHGPAAWLAFRVPRVAPGRYVIGIWCVPCNDHWTTALPNYQPSRYGMLRVLR